MNNYDEKIQIAAGVLSTLIARPDSGLFNYDEMADMAWKYAEALQKRRWRDEELRQQQQNAAIQIAMQTAMQSPSFYLNPRSAFTGIKKREATMERALSPFNDCEKYWRPKK